MSPPSWKGACSPRMRACSFMHPLALALEPVRSWSDHFDVIVARAAAPEVDGRKVGPFNVTEADMKEIVRIGAELDALYAATGRV